MTKGIGVTIVIKGWGDGMGILVFELIPTYVEHIFPLSRSSVGLTNSDKKHCKFVNVILVDIVTAIHIHTDMLAITESLCFLLDAKT
jgi:hypothetical protein